MLQQIQVYIADDDQDDLMFFKETVNEIDPTIICKDFPNGEELLSYLNKNGEVLPSYIFLDINMPKLNGIESLKILKAEQKLKDIPVIMYSTTSNPKDIKHALDLGAVYFLKKPDSIEALHRELDKILKNSY